MNRIQSLSNQLTAATGTQGGIVKDSIDWFGFNNLLGSKAKALQEKLRPYFDSGIVKRMVKHVEEATYPEELLDVIRAQNLGHYFVEKKYGGYGSTGWEKMAIVLELARADASLCTAFQVQFGLVLGTIMECGSEQQKAYYIPKIRDLELVGGFGLTELGNGSDASSITTNVRYEDGYYILNGNKRWIGNANKVKH